MSWHSKVVWREGLFLRAVHFQQSDRYHERLVECRTRHISPYPWGFAELEIDLDKANQRKFALRRAVGIMPDGTPFDIPGDNPPPPMLDVPKNAANQVVWLSIPAAAPNIVEVDGRMNESASRFVERMETFIDSTSPIDTRHEIDVANARLAYDLRLKPKDGYHALGVARIVAVEDNKPLVFDQNFVPPLLICRAHDVVTGWIDRVLGWVESKLEELSRYAADPTSGGGLQSVDYFVLQLLNRTAPTLRHLRNSVYVHPERLFVVLTALAGELATFTTEKRLARVYPVYDHDNLAATFEPVLRDLQDFLSARLGRRAIRLELIERAPNAFVSPVRDRSLFKTASFVLEVAARRPLTEIQIQFPNLFKVGPNTKMNEIVLAHLPGVPLVHLPTPPPQIRALTDHVYFLLDQKSPLWSEFSTAAAIAMHFSGDWPGLELVFWAILEDSR
jgi:type VI secretion system protein ImpJ